MSHPETIIRLLDRHLTRPTRLILYGRAALALGFPPAAPEFHATLDVDVILPESEMNRIDADDQFWKALEIANDELADSGLYITHLFTDAQVILSPGWLHNIVPIAADDLSNLVPFRPSTEDLILTKMMRIDPNDRSDIRFLLSQASFDRRRLDSILPIALVPPIDEISAAFEANKIWLRSLLEIG